MARVSNVARQLPAVSSTPLLLRSKSGLTEDKHRRDRGGVCGLASAGTWHVRTLAKVGKMPADRMSKGGCQVVRHRVLSVRGVRSIRCGWRLSGVPGRVQDGSGAVRCSWTQLHLMGHDPKPASLLRN